MKTDVFPVISMIEIRQLTYGARMSLRQSQQWMYLSNIVASSVHGEKSSVPVTKR